MLHGIIVDRDSDSRDLLVRLLAGLDWNTRAFDALQEAEAHLAGAWALFVSSDVAGGVDSQVIQRLRTNAPGAVIVVILPSLDDARAHELRECGADAILARPLAEPTVIDAVGKALIRRRR